MFLGVDSEDHHIFYVSASVSVRVTLVCPFKLLNHFLISSYNRDVNEI